MKSISFLLLFVASTLALTAEQLRKEQAVLMYNKCKPAEDQIRFEDMTQVHNQSQYVQLSAVRKHLLCVCRVTGLMSQSDEINVDIIKNKLKNQSANEDTISAIEKCLVKKETPEGTAAEIYLCIQTRKTNFVPYY